MTRRGTEKLTLPQRTVMQGLRSGDKLRAGHRCWRFDDGSADRVQCKTVETLIEKGLIVANNKGCALTSQGRYMCWSLPK